MCTSIHIACRVHYRESGGVRLCDCMQLCLRTNIIVMNRKPEKFTDIISIIITYLLTYLLTCLLTYSMEQSPS